jgi:hypothetical protein
MQAIRYGQELTSPLRENLFPIDNTDGDLRDCPNLNDGLFLSLPSAFMNRPVLSAFKPHCPGSTGLAC